MASALGPRGAPKQRSQGRIPPPQLDPPIECPKADTGRLGNRDIGEFRASPATRNHLHKAKAAPRQFPLRFRYVEELSLPGKIARRSRYPLRASSGPALRDTLNSGHFPDQSPVQELSRLRNKTRQNAIFRVSWLEQPSAA